MRRSVDIGSVAVGPQNIAETTPLRSREVIETVYERLVDQEDARTCKDIPEEACRETPGNFFRILLTQSLTALGDAFASPKIVLAWVMATINAPVYLTGFLVPIRESGSLIPQLVIASYVRQLPIRKWVWVAGSVVQALAIFAIGVVAMSWRGSAAGWTIIGLLTVFSLARGMCSVASKDVVGKTIPKTKRGQLSGWSASAAGLVTIAVGGTLLLADSQHESAGYYGALIAAAGSLWLLAAFTYSHVRELPGETAGGANAIVEAFARLDLLRTDAPFRRFVMTRALLLCSALTAPYYVLLAHQRVGSSAYLLGLFLVAGGVANLVSAPVWGRLADRSSRKVMIIAAVMTAATGIVVFVMDRIDAAIIASAWFLPVAYFCLSIAHDGVRLGRKTYVIDLASGNRRTDYVAVSNSVIGVILLVAGSIGALSSFMSVSGVILTLSLFGLLGALMAAGLPEVED